MKHEDEELTAAEVAEELGVAPATVRRYRLDGLLPGTQTWRGLRTVYVYSRAAVDQFKARTRKTEVPVAVE